MTDEAPPTATPPAKESQGKPKKEKKVPEGLVIPPKKPKLTKAERRALQEQQRAAKAAAQGGKQPKKGGDSAAKGNDKEGSQQQQPSASKGGKAGNSNSQNNNNNNTTKKADRKDTSEEKKEEGVASNGLVATLPPYRDPSEIFQNGASLVPRKTSPALVASLHSAVIELGYKYATGQVRGGNARCRHMLACFETVLNDFTPTDPDSSLDYRHVLDQQILKPSFQFWTEECRPHSVSMGNAFTALKAAVASLDRNLPFDAMKSVVLETIHAYTRERIEYADRAISDLACQKLLSSEAEEVILTLGYSEVVDLTLREAAEQKKTNFRVIIVDSQPLMEGRRLLSQLRQAGIECTYVMLNALTYVMQDVTKVLLGASALMSDGSVWGRAGAACVALAAHSQHIPVLVCSETYKISNRVQLESLTTNELGSPFDDSSSSTDEATLPNLKQLNLLYDLTPASFVSGIVTELGIIPPTSVAVLLRELNQAQG